MDALANALGALLKELPPALAAAVLLGGFVVALVYAWRRAGVAAEREREAAQREREAADKARADAAGAQAAQLAATLGRIEEAVGDVATDIKVLLDRGRG